MSDSPPAASLRMFCRQCGYALIGLPGNRCPECGRDFDPADRHTFLRHPRRVMLWRIIKISLVLLCLSLPLAVYYRYLARQIDEETRAIQILTANGATVTMYDATPPWARIVFCGHADWLWRRADSVTTLGGGASEKTSLSVVAKLKSLRRLDLTCSLRWVTDDDLEQIKNLICLQDLSLHYCNVTDAGAVFLKRLTALRKLRLSGTGITAAGLAQLKGLHALQYLELGNKQMMDGGLAQLKEFPALRELDLSTTYVSETELTQLRNLTSLQKLNLDYAYVAEKGVADLHKVLRNCEISHRQANQ